MYQTSVVKVRQVYRRVKRYIPLENPVVKRVIRIAR